MQRSLRIDVYNTSGILQGFTQSVINASFERGLYKPGRFSLQINYNTRDASLFQRGYFVRFDSNNKKFGVITEIKKQVNQSGKQDQIVSVSGYELAFIFSRRIVVPATGDARYYAYGKFETIVKAIILAQAGTGAVANRRIPNLVIATDQLRGIDCTIDSNYGNLIDAIATTSLFAGAGFYSFLDSNGYINFETVHGLDRRSSQSTNNPAIFSTSLGTVKESEYTDTELSYKNLVIVGGQGEGAARTFRTVYDTSEPTGIDRREFFIDSRGQSATADLDKKGSDAITANSVNLYIDSRALEFSKLRYGTDFDLGDLVTLKDFGVTLDAIVTQVGESWSAGEYNIDVTFDKGSPRFDEQIRASITAIQSAISAPLVPQTYGTNLLLSLLKNTATFQNNGSDASNDIDFLTIKAIDTTGVFLFNSSTTVTKRLDASWTAGTNQGGLDTGSEATSTWYACWAIAKADGTIDYLFSLSATAPTMPTGYVYKVRIGWIYNQSTSIIRPFFQKDRLFSWSTQVQDRAIAGYGVATRITITVAAAPLTKAVIICRFLGVAGASYGWIGDVSATDTTPSATYFDFFASNAYSQSAEMEIYVSGTSTIASRTNDGGSTLGVSTKGFIDII